MNKPLTTVEIITAVPVMTKRAKLTRLATLIRHASHNIVIFNGIEYMDARDLAATYHPLSAFALAHADPILKDAGLRSDNAGEAKRFFELTKDELHAFSCDCGGLISNDAMARRVEDIAARA